MYAISPGTWCQFKQKVVTKDKGRQKLHNCGVLTWQKRNTETCTLTTHWWAALNRREGPVTHTSFTQLIDSLALTLSIIVMQCTFVRSVQLSRTCIIFIFIWPDLTIFLLWCDLSMMRWCQAAWQPNMEVFTLIEARWTSGPCRTRRILLGSSSHQPSGSGVDLGYVLLGSPRIWMVCQLHRVISGWVCVQEEKVW